MTNTDSILGRQGLDISGPAAVYWNQSGTPMHLGEIESVSLKIETNTQDLIGGQMGNGVANQIILGDGATLEIVMLEPSPERLAAVQYGATYHTTSGTVDGFAQGSRVFARDSDNSVVVRVILSPDNVDSTDPLDYFDIWKVAPNKNNDILFDKSQRKATLSLRCYKSSAHPDSTGKPTYYGNGTFV